MKEWKSYQIKKKSRGQEVREFEKDLLNIYSQPETIEMPE